MDEVLALVVLLWPPAPSQTGFCPFSQVCVFALCTPAAATFQCLNSHWFLHSRQPNQIYDLTLSTVPESWPIGSHFCMRNLVFGMFSLSLSFSPWIFKAGLPSPATLYTHALPWLEPQGKGGHTHPPPPPAEKTGLCRKLLLCFCLSVRDLQLLNSALPLIKPCSLQPVSCSNIFFNQLFLVNETPLIFFCGRGYLY